MELKWKKTPAGYVANGDHRTYTAKRVGGKSLFTLQVNGDALLQNPLMFTVLKSRCQEIEDKREGEKSLPPSHSPTVHADAAAPKSSPVTGASRTGTCEVTDHPTAPVAAQLLTMGTAAVLKPSLLSTKITPKLVDDSPHLIIEARAGCGKSTTLIEGLKRIKGQPTPGFVPSEQQEAVFECMELSRGKVNSVCMVAFNKSIAAELKSRVPAGCEAYTMNALGMKTVSRSIKLNNTNAINTDRVQKIIEEITGNDVWELRRKKPMLLNAAQKLTNLCKMNLTDVGDRNALDALAAHYDVDFGEVDEDDLREEVFDLVPKVIERCKDVARDGFIDFADQLWLPVALNLPVTKYDLLLVDEAQDLNRCQQELAKRSGKRLILCGDVHQCQPAGTMVTKAGTVGNRWHPAVEGERVPIEDIQMGDVLLGYCPKDGRNYSNRLVQAVVSRDYDGDLVRVAGPGFDTSYTPEHKCFASFGAMRNYYCVYMMERDGQFRIGSCQINYKASGNGLVHRLRTEGGDAAWILEVHQIKREARLQEMELSQEYNLPQVVFPGVANDQGYILDEEGVTRFWKFVGANYKIGEKVLAYYGLLRECPIAVPGEQWQQSFKRPALFKACNLRSGMEVRTEAGNWVRINQVKRMPYRGKVYSLKVSHDELYMADGIVTHNSIYGFAGADFDSLPRMGRELGEAPRGYIKIPLTVTRRCGKAIVREAQRIVPDFQAFESNCEGAISYATYPTDKQGKERPGPHYTSMVKDGDMVLCRCNAPLVSQCFRFLKMGRRANIQGREVGQGLINLVKRLGRDTQSVPELTKLIDEWSQKEMAKEQVKKYPSEARLMAVSDRADCLHCFTENCSSVDEVVKKIESVFTDDKGKPGILLSSIHKAKGLESERVFLLQPDGAQVDHPMTKTAWGREQNQNLLYVAVTRAIKELVHVS